MLSYTLQSFLCRPVAIHLSAVNHAGMAITIIEKLSRSSLWVQKQRNKELNGQNFTWAGNIFSNSSSLKVASPMAMNAVRITPCTDLRDILRRSPSHTSTLPWEREDRQKKMIKIAQICLLFVWTCKATIISILIGKDIFRIDFFVRRWNNFSNTAISHLTFTNPELMTSHKINKKNILIYNYLVPYVVLKLGL